MFRIFFIIILTIQQISYAQVADDINYKTHFTASKQVIHVLTIDPSKVYIKAARAIALGSPRATVASIAKHAQAIAAINGGFFKIGTPGDGLPAGVLKINGMWHGIAYKARGAIGWSTPENSAVIDILQTKTILQVNQQQFSIHTLNQIPAAHRLMLFSDSYGKSLKINNSTKITIQHDTITNLSNQQEIIIPNNSYIYAIGNKIQFSVLNLPIGSPAKVIIQPLPQMHPTHQQKWHNATFILGGAPVLISNRQKITDFSPEKLRNDFINKRRARTAIGILDNKHWVLVVAEQNNFSGIPGLTLAELANFMQTLGCIDALNLDGGRSATLYFKEKIINRPEDNFTIRKVSDALLILRKNN